MKISVYSICWNEEFFLPYYFRHYEKFADEIIVYDNFSSDSSPDIIKSHPLAKYRTYDSGGKQHNDIMRTVKNECWKDTDADWVIVCDIDEILFHPNLRKFLGNATDAVFKPFGYTMITREIPVATGQIYSEVHRGAFEEYYSKMCLFNPKIIKEIGYEFGCHNANPVTKNGENLKVEKTKELKLLHCHYLSLDYVINRWENYRKRMSEFDISKGYGHNYLWEREQMKKEFEQRWEDSSDVL